MADETYEVLVKYTSGGNLTDHVQKAHAHAGKLGEVLSEAASQASEIGSELVHGFQHAVEHAAELAVHMAKIAGALGVGALVYGVGHLNNELEQTQISLAAIFKGQGFAGTFNKAFDMAGDQMTKMKQDINSLPGDLGQLSNVMLQIASPLAVAGKSPDEIRAMAGKTMLASQILLGGKYGHQAQEVGAREMVMALQGNLSSRNSWAMELPGMAKYRANKGQWKGMSEEKRVEVIEGLMDKMVKDAHGKFAESFASIWSTFKDKMKYSFLAPATLPLFEKVKHTLAGINDWFDTNKEKISEWTDWLGINLATAWDRGIALAEDWWPKILSFAEQLRHSLTTMWKEIEPVVARVAEKIKTSLGDGSALNKIEHVLELYAATKVGMPLMSLGMGAAKTTMQMSMMGGGSAAGALGEAATVALPAVGLMIAGLIGAAGAMDDVTNSSAMWYAEAQPLADNIKNNVTFSIDQLGAAFDNLKPVLEDSIDTIGIGLLQATSQASESLRTLADGLVYFTDKVAAGETLLKSAYGIMKKEGADVVDRSMEVHSGFAVSTARAGGTDKEIAKLLKGGGAGGGGTHVQKVEIVINTNQDANRVAEMVVDKISNISRHPKLSSHVPNYSKR